MQDERGKVNQKKKKSLEEYDLLVFGSCCFQFKSFRVDALYLLSKKTPETHSHYLNPDNYRERESRAYCLAAGTNRRHYYYLAYAVCSCISAVSRRVLHNGRFTKYPISTGISLEWYVQHFPTYFEEHQKHLQLEGHIRRIPTVRAVADTMNGSKIARRATKRSHP